MLSQYLGRPQPEILVQKCDRTQATHGRQGSCRLDVCAAPNTLLDRWPGPQALGVVNGNTARDSRDCVSFRYYILHQPLTAKEAAKVVASHLSIGNQPHWQLDEPFRQHHSRVPKRHADINFNTLRKASLALLQNGTAASVGIKTKRMIAAWDTIISCKSLSERRLPCHRPAHPRAAPEINPFCTHKAMKAERAVPFRADSVT